MSGRLWASVSWVASSVTRCAGVGVEVDAGQVAGRTGLVALEQEVGAVVVAGIRTGQTLVEDEIGVLVGLGLVRLVGRVAGQRNEVRVVAVVAVVGDGGRTVLETAGPLGEGACRSSGES
jgi:hypothetical protein